MGSIRACVRLLALLLWLGATALLLVVVSLVTLGSRERVARVAVRLMGIFGRGVTAILGVRVRASGERPRGACLVTPNHWGYTDILVLSSLFPNRFVSMAGVADWPVMGFFAKRSGTIFLERERRRDAHRAGGEVEEHLRLGRTVTVFLEGGAGDGRVVRKFKSALVEPAVACAVPCVPVAIDYELPRSPGLSPSAIVAWLDTDFFGHLWRLVSLPRVDAIVTFLPPRSGSDRKELARRLEDDVRLAMARR